MKQEKVWFVIVTYELEKEALRLLIRVLEELPVIVIDNTETQNSKLKIQNYNAKVQYIRTGKNIGYGGGANVGMKVAFDAGAQWVIVCNQDVALTKSGIAKFVKALEHCEPGIVGPEAGSLDPKRWTTMLASRPGLEAGGREFRKDEPLYITGSLIAVHRDVWEATGGFYEPYFMYYEDVDLCVRARTIGFPMREVRVEGFRHENNGEKSIQKEYYLTRNHLLFVRRLAPVSVKVHELLRLPRTLTEHYQQRNTGAIMGIQDFALGRFTSLKAGP